MFYNNKLLLTLSIITFYTYWLLEFLNLLPVYPIILQILGITTVVSVLLYFKNYLLKYLRIKPLLIGFVLYVEFTVLWMYFKHLSFETFAFDLGIFMQALYTTLYNHLFFFESPDLFYLNLKDPFQLSFFDIHFSPILFLLLPFYASFPSELTLFIIQSVVSALPIFVIYAIAREFYDYKNSVTISLFYLINPLLYYANFYDFHLEAFLPLLFLLSTYFFFKNKLKKFYISLILAFSTIEGAPVLYLFYIPYLFLKKRDHEVRKKLLYSIPLAISFYGLNLLVKHILSHSTPNFLPYNPSLDKLHVILEVIGPFFIYIILFLLPVSLAPIFRILPSLPGFAWLFYGLSTLYYPYYSVYFQYNYLVIPFFYVSFIEFYKFFNIENYINKVFSIILLSILTLFASQPIFILPPSMLVPKVQQSDLVLNNIINSLPSLGESCILTMNEIFPHVANNKCTFLTFLNISLNPDYIILKNFDNINSFYIISNYSKNKNYNIVAMSFPDFIILGKWNNTPIFYKPLNELLYLYSNKTNYIINYFIILFPEKKYEINVLNNITGNITIFDYNGNVVFKSRITINNKTFIIEPKELVNLNKIVIVSNELVYPYIELNIKEINS